MRGLRLPYVKGLLRMPSWEWQSLHSDQAVHSGVLTVLHPLHGEEGFRVTFREQTESLRGKIWPIEGETSQAAWTVRKLSEPCTQNRWSLKAKGTHP